MPMQPPRGNPGAIAQALMAQRAQGLPPGMGNPVAAMRPQMAGPAGGIPAEALANLPPEIQALIAKLGPEAAMALLQQGAQGGQMPPQIPPR